MTKILSSSASNKAVCAVLALGAILGPLPSAMAAPMKQAETHASHFQDNRMMDQDEQMNSFKSNADLKSWETDAQISKMPVLTINHGIETKTIVTPNSND
jgi:hypothetical protein